MNGITLSSIFAWPVGKVYHQVPLLRSFSAIVPEPKDGTRPAEPTPKPKGHDVLHFGATSQTRLPQLSATFEIGCVLLPSPLGPQRQSPYLPQYTCK
jgi:hypothetical protein